MKICPIPSEMVGASMIKGLPPGSSRYHPSSGELHTSWRVSVSDPARRRKGQARQALTNKKTKSSQHCFTLTSGQELRCAEYEEKGQTNGQTDRRTDRQDASLGCTLVRQAEWSLRDGTSLPSEASKLPSFLPITYMRCRYLPITYSTYSIHKTATVRLAAYMHEPRRSTNSKMPTRGFSAVCHQPGRYTKPLWRVSHRCDGDGKASRMEQNNYSGKSELWHHDDTVFDGASNKSRLNILHDLLYYYYYLHHGQKCQNGRSDVSCLLYRTLPSMHRHSLFSSDLLLPSPNAAPSSRLSR
ncbi:hypothetical protein CIB48_g6439 [Xylaria polymorpha]|nr:hypothetical protein CIB48_g6439 [Xylaria polymorpha]